MPFLSETVRTSSATLFNELRKTSMSELCISHLMKNSRSDVFFDFLGRLSTWRSLASKVWRRTKPNFRIVWFWTLYADLRGGNVFRMRDSPQTPCPPWRTQNSSRCWGRKARVAKLSRSFPRTHNSPRRARVLAPQRTHSRGPSVRRQAGSVSYRWRAHFGRHCQSSCRQPYLSLFSKRLLGLSVGKQFQTLDYKLKLLCK